MRKTHSHMWHVVLTLVLCTAGFILSGARAEDGQNPPPDPTKMKGFPRLDRDEGPRLLKAFAKTYSTREEWEDRAEAIRQSILEAAGLEDIPQERPVNPIIRHHREYEGYTVDNVALESLPGFYTTGTLYRPLEPDGKEPAILCPHGHFKTGRFRPSHQTRCAMLARMGAVVVAYDMVGYGDCDQVKHKNRHALTVQLLDSMRWIDFMQSLDEVDDSRIGVSGASGGGTQTFLLAAVDDRVAASAPVVMVSAHFFGGCVCESGKPIHRSPATNNAEMAALAAPRPQLIISDGADWTRNVPEVSYPYIRNVYAFYGAENRVENVHLPDEQHDYGYSKRRAAYDFFARTFGLTRRRDLEQGGNKVPEQVTIEDDSALHVWTEEHPRPENALKGIEALEKALEEYTGHEF